MWLFYNIFFLSFATFSYCDVGVLFYQPEQVHLAYGDTVRDIVVTWSTFNETKSFVEYGIDSFSLKVEGTSKLFEDAGSGRKQWIHKVVIANLDPSTLYLYHCGSDLGWSNLFWFKTPPPDEEWQPHLVFYGDMGNENAKSLGRLQEEAQLGVYDAVLHVGDFAYDMDSEGGTIGDQFMRQIEAVAGYLPYMTCPGNHEASYNFQQYNERFNMPGFNGSVMYSINIGPLHLISISTEVYYYLEFGVKKLVTQWEWLKADLINANLPENREKQPWIVVMGHRPMYCSNANHDDCTNHETIIRTGYSYLHLFGLEKLFYDYGVDLEIWAHEHNYERLWPIYDYVVYNGSYEEPYTNPTAPVHITTGSAGCLEGREPANKTRPYWSAFINNDYGYTRLKAYNKSHLHFEQVSDDQNGAIIDSFWFIKDGHGPYPFSKMDLTPSN